jgi:hypothetical protein
MARALDLGSVSTRLHRIAELARRAPEMVIVTLAHHIDLAWLYGAYRQTRKDGAAGTDEVTAAEYAEGGTPQGGVISPLLANIYLHEVLDRWFVEQVQPRMHGPAHLIRYADDFVMVFADEADARRVMEVLPKRFAKYGLTLHPEKTRLIDYRRPSGTRRDLHVRIRGGPGRVTARVYPTPFRHPFPSPSRTGRRLRPEKASPPAAAGGEGNGYGRPGGAGDGWFTVAPSSTGWCRRSRSRRRRSRRRARCRPSCGRPGRWA